MKKLALAVAALATTVTIQAQDQNHNGWPGYSDISDLEASFLAPPSGYGNVPFYWWTGDPLDMERLTEQLELLSDASTSGLCVSYNHTHDKVDPEINAAGHGPCGRVSGGEPRVMSAGWFELWNEFSAECARKGIGLGMDDYVLAWPRNGEFMDSVILAPDLRDYQGMLVLSKLPATQPKPDNALAVFGESGDSTTYICTEPSPWLHPQIGQRFIDAYFSRFESCLSGEGRAAMNYFFQDELQYGLTPRSWSEDMREQFLSRKGYDILPHLGALFIEDASLVDAEAARVRLDYCEVLTQLAEERFFKPIFDWNSSRGLIYGCDNEGRGKNPLQYVDYFRAISWFTAPGNDAPSRGSSFTQTKVSSSIAHLYDRPRTWLEAFHSIGWDANGALLKRQLDHHMIAGGNLLCMHGLYYSTHGGWWEWAPPCFHFRMPYWKHMKLWLKYAERMSFILSQGEHVCDLAVLYPTETMQAFPGTSAGSTFKVTDELSAHGLDYDFIDYQSIQKAVIVDGCLNVSGESYRVLLLVDTKALHAGTLEKIKHFIKTGGLVVAVGEVLPELEELGVTHIDNALQVCGCVSSLISRDFTTSSGQGRVLHRRIGERDVYMVMDVPHGDVMTFRASGRAERWDAMDGSIRALKVESTGTNGSSIVYEGESGEAMLVVFSKGEPCSEVPERNASKTSVTRVDGDWDIEIIPTMNNRWGDFRLPASPGLIGVEAREFSCRPVKAMKGLVFEPEFYGYGPHMLTAVADSGKDLDAIVSSGLDKLDWQPYSWSWQYGVRDNPGGQGWHGLKSKVESRFIILDKGCHQFYKTNVYAPESGKYSAFAEGTEPTVMLLDGKPFRAGEILLEKGWHSLVLAYGNTPYKEYDLSAKRGSFSDGRERSMVVFYPAGTAMPEKKSMYDTVVGSRWYGTPHLEYDICTRSTVWEAAFETAPGTVLMKFPVHGTVRSIMIDGRKNGFRMSSDTVIVEPSVSNPGVSKVLVSYVPEAGYPGAAFFDGPVSMDCRGGRMPEGDWTSRGALGFYSGGVRYSKVVEISGAGSITLDLGEVDATCEIMVNGEFVKALISKPYTVDITEFVKEGPNTIEVLVYSTLSNHYRTIPSPYRGTPRAGLIGPVNIISR